MDAALTDGQIAAVVLAGALIAGLMVVVAVNAKAEGRPAWPALLMIVPGILLAWFALRSLRRRERAALLERAADSADNGSTRERR